MRAFKVGYIRKEDVQKMLELDGRHYKTEHCVPLDTTKKRLVRNPKTDIVAMDGDALIGYLSLLPVTEELFASIQKGSASEAEIEDNTLAYDRPGNYVAYLSSIVVDKATYPWFRGKYFIEYLEAHLQRLKKAGIFVQKMIAFAVSEQGSRFLQRVGFREIAEHIYLFVYQKDGYQLAEKKHLYALFDEIAGRGYL